MRSKNGKKAWGWALLTAAIAIGVAYFFSGLRTFWSGTLRSAEVVPEGTILTIQVAHSLSSKTMRLGEVFEGRIISAESVKGAPVFPPSTRVRGRCVAVRRAEGQGQSGYLRLALSSVFDSQGNLSPLASTTFSQWGDKPIGLASHCVQTDALSIESENVVPRAGNSDEAVVTPEALLTFTLLEPAVVTRRRQEPRPGEKFVSDRSLESNGARGSQSGRAHREFR